MSFTICMYNKRILILCLIPFLLGAMERGELKPRRKSGSWRRSGSWRGRSGSFKSSQEQTSSQLLQSPIRVTDVESFNTTVKRCLYWVENSVDAVQATAYLRLGDVYRTMHKLKKHDTKGTLAPVLHNNQEKAREAYLKGYNHQAVLPHIKALCALQLGYICLYKKKYVRAETYCEFAKKNFEGELWANALNALGVAYHGQNKIMDAIVCWKNIVKAQSMSPDTAKALQNLSVVSQDHGLHKAALEYLLQAKECGHPYDEQEYTKRVEALRTSIAEKTNYS